MTSQSTDPNVNRLRVLDICDLSDALDALGLPASVTGLIGTSAQRPIAGRAVTVKLVAGNAPGGASRHLCTAAVEAADTDSVIVIEQRSGLDAASWGAFCHAPQNTAVLRGRLLTDRRAMSRKPIASATPFMPAIRRRARRGGAFMRRNARPRSNSATLLFRLVIMSPLTVAGVWSSRRPVLRMCLRGLKISLPRVKR
jgi:hypothetical protein